MSRRYDIEWKIANWCAVRELPQNEVADLLLEVLASAGQVETDIDSEDYFAGELERIERDVAHIYARTLGYEEPQ